MTNLPFFILTVTLCLGDIAKSSPGPVWRHYQGMCDASAVEMLDQEYFAVGNDEDNILRVYARSRAGFPATTLDLSRFLVPRRKTLEADLEAAARVGNRIYWIASHGANSKGRFQPTRHRFFATTIGQTNGAATLQPYGLPYDALLRDLAQLPALASFQLSQGARKAPKSTGALNIEGLAAMPEGGLLIGFRNPIPGGRALLVPLRNPDEVVHGHPARFGEPVLLDLGGLGIRSLALRGDRYLIVAGSFESGGTSSLYEWKPGEIKARPLTVSGLAGVNPEGIAIIPGADTRHLWVVSDDGTCLVNGIECKRLKDERLKSFRAFELELPGDLSQAR